MNWTHLPNAGGLYDQHPDFIADLWVIFAAQAKKEAEEKRRQEFESKPNRKVAGGRRH